MFMMSNLNQMNMLNQNMINNMNNWNMNNNNAPQMVNKQNNNMNKYPNMNDIKNQMKAQTFNNNIINKDLLNKLKLMNMGIKINPTNNQNIQFNPGNNNVNLISNNQNFNQFNQANKNFMPNTNSNQNNQINQANNNSIPNSNNNVNMNQINQGNNNFIPNSNNQNNNQFNNQGNNNFIQNQNNQNFNQDQNTLVKLNSIYNNLQQKNFTYPPNFVNSLTKETTNISPQNRQSLDQILKSVKVVYITPLEIIYKEQYDLAKNTSKEREKCPICLCEFYDDVDPDNKNFVLQPMQVYLNHEIDVVKLFRCEDHFYHIECLNNLIKDKNGGGFKCAMCQKIYGILEGTMPPGTMTARISKSSRCDGYPKDNTIVISYHIPSGYQNGKSFSGTSRTCYLPNNKEGREVLALLKIAFDRKLTFVVGTSVTTGQKNTVVWNGIHHKTNLSGGTNYYGYPDSTYFNRVKEELAAKGVIKDDFGSQELEKIAKNLWNIRRHNASRNDDSTNIKIK
jgi:deltex-like protein